MTKQTLLGSVLIALTSLATAQTAEKANFDIRNTQHLNCEVYQLVYNPTKQAVYVAGPQRNAKEGPHYIYVLDANNLAIKDSISTGSYQPFGIALNNKTQTLYVGHSRQNSISAIDLKNNKQTLISNGKERSKIREIVVDESRNKVYVSDHGNPSIWEIDGSKNTFKRSLNKDGAYLLGLQVDPERGKIYGTDGQDMKGNVLVFNSESGKLEAEYQTWSYCPMNIAIDKAQNRIFVSQSNDNNITVLDGNTGNIIDKIYLGYDSSPIGLVFDQKNNLIYSANRSKKEVAVINAKDYTVIERIPTEGLPNTITLDQESGAIYVTNKKPKRGDEELANANTVVKITKN